MIAVAAVRLAAWELAYQAVERYAAVEPDTIESWRLRRWVESRQRGDVDSPLVDLAPYMPLLGRGI